MSLIALFSMALLIAVGCVNFSTFLVLGYTGSLSAVELTFIAFVACAAFAPLMPLATMLLIRFTSFSLRYWQAALPSITTGLIGSVGTLLTAVFAAGGFSMTFVHGFALITAIISSLLLLVNPRQAPRIQRAGFYLMICPSAVAIWSLTNAVALAMSATSIAGTHPFCLVRDGDNEAISQLIDLRGLSLYTTKPGFKDADVSFFHSVLFVRVGNELNSYNWSLRGMRFELLAIRQFGDFPSDCTPQQDFLRTVPLVRI